MKLDGSLVILILSTTVFDVLTFENIEEKNRTKNQIRSEGRSVDKKEIKISSRLSSSLSDCLEDGSKCLIVCNQLNSGVYIYDLNMLSEPIWQVVFDNASDIAQRHKSNFEGISDAKLIYTNYLAVCASGGGVAIIDLNTKRILKYYVLNANLHSIEVSPDGAIFVVASTQAYIIALSGITKANHDTYGGRKGSMIKLEAAHALIWDFSQSVLWAGGEKKINKYKYNWDIETPKLLIEESFTIDDDDIHDISPIGNSGYLWITSSKCLSIFNPSSGNWTKLFEIEDVKSVSTHPCLGSDFSHTMTSSYRSTNQLLTDQLRNLYRYYPTQNLYEQHAIRSWNETEHFRTTERNNFTGEQIAIYEENTVYVQPKNPGSWVEWWTNEVKELKYRKTVLRMPPDARIYKARWFYPSAYSYQMANPRVFL